MNQNIVEFGLKNLHIGPYTVGQDGTATLGEGVAVPGLVSLGLEAESELYKFFADNVVYYSEYTDQGESGDLTMALIPDQFKIDYLGFKEMADGGIAKIKGVQGQAFWMAFEGEGDKHKRRHVMLNVIGGAIQREYRTIGESKEVDTEVVPLTINGDNASGIVKISYNPTDAGYDTAFTAPTVPAEVEEPETP
jgi:phi13 family phage major tail protein